MRESKIAWQLEGKVSVIRDLGYNYTIARRKKHAGGISLQSMIPNEFSLPYSKEPHL